ncbi:MAG: glycerol-3-phosphate acyltransferase, partial [Burkholderiaceae bacterium]
MTLVIALLAGYLIGSVSFAVLVSRSLGLDDRRSSGSGSPGARTVLSTGNRDAARVSVVGHTRDDESAG